MKLITYMFLLVLSTVILGTADNVLPAPSPGPPRMAILEGYPQRIVDRIKTLRASLTSGPPIKMDRLFYLIQMSRRWIPGQTVTVAFRGGNLNLYQKIAAATTEWTSNANIKLDFGNVQSGEFRQWSLNDAVYSADIRISFDQNGYYSYIGTESIDSALVKCNEESMNFQGFDKSLPADWQGVVRHEFGHALGFEHEHQHPGAGCDFHWDDDGGYVVTTDQYGSFIPDAGGRRPGIYRMLEGPPNNWTKDMIDANLREFPPSATFAIGSFDKASIMEYYFPAYMFVAQEKSPCFLDHENSDLSTQDIVGLKHAYPYSQNAISQITSQRIDAIHSLSEIKTAIPAYKESSERIEELK